MSRIIIEDTNLSIAWRLREKTRWRAWSPKKAISRVLSAMEAKTVSPDFTNMAKRAEEMDSSSSTAQSALNAAAAKIGHKRIVKISEKKANEIAEIRSKLRLISVCNAENGVVLFEKVWKWLEHHDSSIVGNLVRSFFQIAKQLDHGMVTRVVFEHEAGAQDAGNHGSTDSNPMKSSSIQRMQMLCTRNDYVVVSLFYDMDLEHNESSADKEEAVHNTMRQFVEQSRELWPQELNPDKFDRTLNALLKRILRALAEEE